MNIALIVFGALLGVAAGGSGFGKLKKVPQIVETLAAVGVKPNQIPVLGTLELLGTLGLIIGIWFKPLGLLSAACLALYFLGAVGSHVLAKGKLKEMVPAIVILVIALAVTYLEFIR